MIQEVRAQLIGEAPAARVRAHAALRRLVHDRSPIGAELITLHVLPVGVRTQPRAIGNAAFIPPLRAT
jgi:hypothetical protein